MTADLTLASAHPFTAAGLGAAPFRVIGSAERTHNVPGMAARAGGCCKFCYTGIRYAAVIQSADGNVFDVGLDCVRKVDHATYLEAREHFAAARREAKQAARAERAAAEYERTRATREERAAREAERDAANLATWRAAEPALAAIVDAYISDDGFAGSYAGRILAAVKFGDTDAEKHAERCERLRAYHIERTAVGHVGTVGKRETFTATYVGFIAFETSFGISRVFKLRVSRADGTHAIMTWKTGSWLCDKAGNPVAEGAEVCVKATVKAHGEYRGAPQTEVSRLTLA